MEAVVTLNENSPGVKYLCAKDKPKRFLWSGLLATFPTMMNMPF